MLYNLYTKVYKSDSPDLIIIDIKKPRDHVTNELLNHLRGQTLLREAIRERQLNFTGCEEQRDF